jgi:NAD+ synthase (glutamine-hydrolysing)
MHDGTWAGTARKRHLPNYGVFDENRYFTAERQANVFRRGEITFGVNICEDIWVAGGPAEEQVVRGGAEVIFNLSASPYHAQKADERRRMIVTRATDNLAVVCYVNLVGGQDEVVFDGASLVVDERGRVLAEGAPFAEDMVVADIDLDEVFNARLHDTRLREGRALTEDAPLPRIDIQGVAPAAARPARVALSARPAAVGLEPAAEIYAALTLGVRDYVAKNGFKAVVLGLSGGIDSALTATIATDALGPANVIGVSMPSVYTSGDSLTGADGLARALGIRLETIAIRDVIRGYEAALARVFAGCEPDITEENLQARVRGNYLMALSNKFGWLVLTTGNKSEVSVGYSTLYGDSAGGFSALKDVYKTQVYELSRWRNTRGAVIPENTISRPPTAELRPNQADLDSLPPYEVLDAILRLYVEDDRSIAHIVKQGFDENVVRKVARLVDLAEYKRRQSAPGIKITPRAFGRDRRLPITNHWRG